MNLLRVTGLSVCMDGRRIVDRVSFGIKPGETVGLIGPNGAGKTTLLRAAIGLLPHQGHSSLDDLPRRERARAIAFLPQGREIAWSLPVRHVVALGRSPFGVADPRHPAVIRALDMMRLEDLADRPATHLSGGEQARVLIARVIAQEAPLMVVDEPVAGLDPRHQIETMRVFREIAAAGDRAVIASIHDLGLAARHCTRLILMDQGRLVADGEPAEVLDDEMMACVFGISCFRASTKSGLVFQPLAICDGGKGAVT